VCNTIVEAGAVGAEAIAASRYGSGSSSGSDQKMRLLAAPAPQHWQKQVLAVGNLYSFDYFKYFDSNHIYRNRKYLADDIHDDSAKNLEPG
jgi:hypothetical protein